MDKGFRRWFCQVVASHVKRETNDVIEKHRAERLVAEEEARTRWRRCGFDALGMVARTVVWSTGLAALIMVWAGLLVGGACIVGSVAFLGCALRLPENQCMHLELVERNGKVQISSEHMWHIVELVSAWQWSVRHVMREVIGNRTMDRIEGPICEHVHLLALNHWERWAGVYHKL